MLTSVTTQKVFLQAALTLSGGLCATVGCSNQEMMQTLREAEIREAEEAIERIKNDRSISNRQKQMMIERIQMDLDEMTAQRSPDG